VLLLGIEQVQHLSTWQLLGSLQVSVRSGGSSIEGVLD
jgi:hypothetical protein